jgi:predicted phage terminase large subunit-like protein
MLYQQDVDAQALPATTADHFPMISEAMPPGAPIVLSVDAGMTDGKKSAFSVIQAWRVGTDRHHLIDQFRQRCDFSDLMDALRYFRRKYKPVAILIERAANGHALISRLKRRSPKVYKRVRPVEPVGSKSARLRVHAETIIAKRIHLPADEPWVADFISEIVEFPHGRYSDQVDALTQFLDYAGEFAVPKASPPAGMAVLSLPSSFQTIKILPSTEGEPGLIAGTHGNGQTNTGRLRLTPLPPFKVHLR